MKMKKKPTHTRSMKRVLVRTYAAGVHYGVLVRRRGQEVELRDARRIWEWHGAYTLHEIAAAGLDQSRSKVSVAVPSIVLLDALEVIECTPDAVHSLQHAGWSA
jgi:hypothetical protein